MKTLSTALALLLLVAAPAFAADAGETVILANGEEVDVSEATPLQGLSPTERDENNQTVVPIPRPKPMSSGKVMGPECPPFICPVTEQDRQKQAFETAATLAEDPTAPPGGITPPNQAPRCGREGDCPSTGAGSVNALGPGKPTFVDLPGGKQLVCDLYSCRDATPEEKAQAAEAEQAKKAKAAADAQAAAQQEADRNRGFTPNPWDKSPGGKQMDSKTKPETETASSSLPGQGDQTPAGGVAIEFIDSGLLAGIGGDDQDGSADGFDSKTSPGGKVRKIGINLDENNDTGLLSLIEGERRIKELIGEDLPRLSDSREDDDLQKPQAPTVIKANK